GHRGDLVGHGGPAGPVREPWLQRPPRRPRGRRWLVITGCAVTAAVVGFGLVALTRPGNPSLPSTALSPGSVTPPARGAAAASGAAPVVPSSAGAGPSDGAVPSSGAGPSGASGSSPSAVPPGGGAGGLQPPVTQAQAQQVLAHYTATGNTANARASQ